MPSVHEMNPMSPETVECPYPFYKAMREEAPVYQVPGAGFFIVSRYDDIKQVSADIESFSSNSGPGVDSRGGPMVDEELMAIMKDGYPPVNTLLSADPPDHARYRGLVNKAFSARRVAGMEGSIRAIAQDLFDKFKEKGSVELIHEFAAPLPLTVIARALGVSSEDMWTFKRWSDDAVAPLSGFLTRERSLECAKSGVEFQQYFAARLDERRAEPKDDFLTDLINARIDGEKPLNTPEMLSILQQILVAGNETTTNLIASGTMLLCQNPKEMSRLQADPSIATNVVEEALRVEAPVQGLFRMAKVDTEIGGVKVPAGSRLVLMYASANRDECQFAESETFDVARDNARNHLAFGHGIHFCLGAALARMEGIIAFEMISTLKNLRLAEGKNDLTHTPSFILRGLKELHLEFDPA